MTNKNLITNIVAVAVVILTAVQGTISTMEGTNIDWLKVAMGVGVAIVGYYTGKENK